MTEANLMALGVSPVGVYARLAEGDKARASAIFDSKGEGKDRTSNAQPPTLNIQPKAGGGPTRSFFPTVVECRPMRRLLRILTSAATVLSLGLCIATAALWVRSRWATDSLSFAHYPAYYYEPHAPPERLPDGMCFHTCFFENTTDCISVQWNAVHLEADPSSETKHYDRSDPGPFSVIWGDDRTGSLGRAGLHLAFWRSPVLTGWTIGLPHWLILLLTGLIPGRKLIGALRRRRRALRAVCVNCGYDLRATPDRCPECGTLSTGFSPDAPARRPADRSG
jgi:hypothetical protein